MLTKIIDGDELKNHNVPYKSRNRFAAIKNGQATFFHKKSRTFTIASNFYREFLTKKAHTFTITASNFMREQLKYCLLYTAKIRMFRNLKSTEFLTLLYNAFSTFRVEPSKKVQSLSNFQKIKSRKKVANRVFA